MQFGLEKKKKEMLALMLMSGATSILADTWCYFNNILV